ncbi:MAG: hypothetical protein M3024_09865, partial [Candidatus Dormibacteraeota bacterium]|nr:hypothetical protein [Candidatus Dormibacteraeota bacterium]
MRTATRALRRPAAVPLHLDSPMTDLPRCGTAHARDLDRLGIRTVRDLLSTLPYELSDFGEPGRVEGLRPATQGAVVGTVESVRARRAQHRNLKLTELLLRDDAGARLKVVWFNMPFVARQVHAGDRLALAGPVNGTRFGLGVEMLNPRYEKVDPESGTARIGGLTAKYHLTGGLTTGRVAGWVEAALPLAPGLLDPLPAVTLERHRLLSLADAVRQGHRPDSWASWEAARHRFVFAELLEFQSAFLLARRQLQAERASEVPYRQDVIDRFKAGLGFEFTRGQRQAIWEVFKDLAQSEPMNRLLDGDVGSGKT